MEEEEEEEFGKKESKKNEAKVKGWESEGKGTRQGENGKVESGLKH